jgi:hypothetical protein
MAENTQYVVLKLVTADEVAELANQGREFWLTIDDSVGATGNTEAIKAATKDMSAEEKKGTYAAPSVRNFPVLKRDIRTEEIDDFGTPSTAGTRPRTKPEPTPDV